MSQISTAFVVRFSDGLGNQLFQYAFARMHAYQSGAPLLYDCSWYKSESARPDRPFLMTHYRISAREWTVEEAAQLELPQMWSVGILRRLPWLAAWRFGRSLYLERPEDLLRSCDSYRVDWARSRGVGYAAGYFASYKYAESIRDLLSVELTPVKPYEGETIERARQLQDEESVCVCVRRGDLAKLSYYGVLGDIYYDRAIELLKSRVPNSTLYVFSDAPEAALNLLRKHGVVCHSWPNADRPVPETLFLMSQCRHFILANSTFGWWAAWLGRKPSSVVVRPEKWFLGLGRSYENLFPPDWYSIAA